MKRRQATYLVAAIILIAAVAGSSIFWLFVMPDVDFWIVPNYEYQKVADNWVTTNYANNASASGCFIPIGCKNSGFMPATFVITAIFCGASFSTDTPMPYQQVSDTAAKFSFTLGGYQEKNVTVHFTITNSTRFNISLSLQTSQGLFRIADAQRGQPWDVSYRQLYFYAGVSNGKFTPVEYLPALIA